LSHSFPKPPRPRSCLPSHSPFSRTWLVSPRPAPAAPARHRAALAWGPSSRLSATPTSRLRSRRSSAARTCRAGARASAATSSARLSPHGRRRRGEAALVVASRSSQL
ncbi:uncharacterized protein RHOBADRAFT_66869, partial [Rhodotorula graminis WP1]